MAKQEKKFPSGVGVANAGEVNGDTPVMVATSGGIKRLPLDRFKDYLEITGQSLDPIASGALPTPPAGQRRTMDVVGGVNGATWTHETLPGGSASLTSSQTGTLLWNGSTWALTNVVDLPKGEDGKTAEPFDEAKFYSEGDQVIWNGDSIYEVMSSVSPGQNPYDYPELFERILESGKIYYYSKIKGKNIRSGVTFIDDEGDKSLYMVKEGQMLRTYQIPSESVNTILERIGSTMPIDANRTSFAKEIPTSLNLANPKNLIENRAVNYDSGTLDPAEGYFSFHLIPVKPAQQYSFSRLHNYAWYDERGNFINGAGTGGLTNTSLTSPSNAQYISFDTIVRETQIQEGSVSTPYEPYKSVISIEDLDVGLQIFGNNNQLLYGAGNTDTDGVNNFAIGLNSLKKLQTGVGNVAIGLNAMSSQISNNGNVAIGVDAMKDSIECDDCTVIGWEAGLKLVQGVGDTALGRRALASSLLAANNTAIGDSTLFMVQATNSPRKGFANVAVGYTALEYCVNINDCIGIGSGTGRNMVDGEGNILIGTLVMASTTVGGSRNIALGTAAMYEAECSDNISIGDQTLNANTGGRNVAIGTQAGQTLVEGYDNVFIGYKAGRSTPSNINNSIVIGSELDPTRSNEIVIGKNTSTHVTLAGVEFTREQILALKALVSS